ncbi:hypothetical protein L1887_34892 [Cichorium endivia]|nr:hypothetical protein L1887_34892 [Cichorium endivia]
MCFIILSCPIPFRPTKLINVFDTENLGFTAPVLNPSKAELDSEDAKKPKTNKGYPDVTKNPSKSQTGFNLDYISETFIVPLNGSLKLESRNINIKRFPNLSGEVEFVAAGP